MAEAAHLVLRLWGVPYLAAAAIVCGLAALVLVRGRGPVRYPFFGLLLSLGTPMLGWGLLRVAGDARTAVWAIRCALATAVFTAPMAVSVASTMTNRPLPRLLRATWLCAAGVAALALFSSLVLSGARPFAYGWMPDAGPAFPLVLVAVAPTLTLPIQMARHLPSEGNPLVRRQLELVLIASLVGLVASIDLVPLYGVTLPPIGWAPLGVSGMLLIAAVVRYRLLDVRLAAWRLVLWIALTGTGALPFVVAAVPLQAILHAGRPWVLAATVALLLLIMRAYLERTQPRLEALVGRRRRDLDAAMSELESQTATLQTLDEMGLAIDRFLGALDRRLAALVVVDELGRPRVALSALGSVPAPTRGSPLLHELARARAPISVDRVRGPARAEIERACVRWGAEYLAPLVEGDQLIGVVAISPRGDGGLSDVFEQAALDRLGVVVTAALAGARLYERLQALSSELELKAAARAQMLARTVADLRGAEARLVQQEKLAMLGQIVAGVAADLRAQVGAVYEAAERVRGGVEVLAAATERARGALPSLGGPELDEAARDVPALLHAVGEGARRASAIARDLSGFAPDDSGGVSGVRTPAALAELCEATLALVGGQLRQIRVERRYDPTVPAAAVDAGPIGQVILNLVLNAAQAMREGGTLTVATRREGDAVELSVGDTGPGIAPEVLPHIFEPFFTTKGPSTGSGLGLSVSFGIVQRHGGRIAVESEPGRGSTFRVLLPAA